MPRIGRPVVDLPEGMSPEMHEAERAKLGLSKRSYAKRIGVPPQTYLNKTPADPWVRGWAEIDSLRRDIGLEHAERDRLAMSIKKKMARIMVVLSDLSEQESLTRTVLSRTVLDLLMEKKQP